MGIRPGSAENHRSVPTSTYKGFNQRQHNDQDYRLLLTSVTICAKFIKSITKSKSVATRISEFHADEKRQNAVPKWLGLLTIFHAVVWFLLAARVSPRAVAATRHQTTTKPAVQAEKTFPRQSCDAKSIIRFSTKRNPGKKGRLAPKSV